MAFECFASLHRALPVVPLDPPSGTEIVFIWRRVLLWPPAHQQPDPFRIHAGDSVPRRARRREAWPRYVFYGTDIVFRLADRKRDGSFSLPESLWPGFYGCFFLIGHH